MNPKTGLPDSETAVPIGKAVIGTFAKSPCIFYANHDNGSLYISNGQYIMKADPMQLDDLIEQANKRRRSESEKITLRERPELLKYVSGDKGNFELAGEPLEFEISDKFFISLYADEKQYFGYDKNYVDVFCNGENRLFVDDNAGYDANSHNMIVKSLGGEVLGVVLPIRLTDKIYTELADVLPLKVKWKTELERIKENPSNDPYIGKEFFDGRDSYIISALREVNGADVYIVPNVVNGEVSRYAAHVKADEMENQIMRWETDRINRGNEIPAPPAEQESPPAQEDAAAPPRPFTHIRQSPWGEVQASEKLCPGVFMVSAEKNGGVMVARDMTAALSPAALKHGVKHNGFLCFEDNGAKDVALRELLDKKLIAVPGNTKEKAAAEENINKSLRERSPQYWRSRENRQARAKSGKTATANEER